MGFVSLHNHSDYSLLDGASQISKIIRTVKKVIHHIILLEFLIQKKLQKSLHLMENKEEV